MIKHSGHLPRERIAEDFVWAQWDMSEQRLYYVDPKVKTSPHWPLFLLEKFNFDITIYSN